MYTDTPSLASFVTTRRKKLNLRQSDLANALGYTVQAISKFESGESQIAISSLPVLANLLALSVDDLLACREGETPVVGAEPLNQDLLRANLVTLRTNAHLSIAKEAEVLGVSKNTVIHYEAGTSLPTFEALSKILSYYCLTPSAFLYASVAPSSPIAPLTPTAAPETAIKKKKPFFQSPLGFLLLAIAIIAISLGITLPLVFRKATAVNNGFSSSSSSSLSSSSESSSSSSNNSSSNSVSTSIDTRPDLSINIPGLKSLYLKTKDTQKTLSFSSAPGDYVLQVCSEGFAFTEENNEQYKFEAYLVGNGQPLNVTIASTDVYAEETLHIPTTMPDLGTFTLGLRAWNVLHPTEYVEETSKRLKVSVVNPAGPDLNENFPGLKRLSIAYNGASDNATLVPGHYALSYVSSPANYFDDHGDVITFEIDTPMSGVSLSSDTSTLTIDSSVTDGTACKLNLLVVNLDKKAFSITGTFYVANPNGDIDSVHFPGIKSIQARYNGNSTPTLGPGLYQIDVEIVNDGTLDLTKNYALRMGSVSWHYYPSSKLISVEVPDIHVFKATMQIFEEAGTSGTTGTYDFLLSNELTGFSIWNKNPFVVTIA